VIAVADEECCQLVQAHIALADNVAHTAETDQRLKDHSKTTIALYQYPRSVIFVCALQVNHHLLQMA
jgi:acyl-coenzyme A synthetase/AMP-(fatty) acid ligase